MSQDSGRPSEAPDGMRQLRPTHQFGSHLDGGRGNNIALLRTQNASFIALPSKNNVHILCDMNRLSDRMHASSNPPFSPWQVLDEAVEGKLSCLSWCEEMVGENKDCWLAAVSE